VPFHRDFDCGLEIVPVKRFQNKAVMIRCFDAIDRFTVGIRGQINDRHIDVFANFACGLNAILLAAQPDIH